MAPDLKIKATNYVANLIATPKNTKFHPIINFLNNCPLTHALTATPTMDQQLLVEFWSTASTTSGFSYLSGKVNGKELRFTSTTLATALQLPTDPTEEEDPPSKEQIWEMLEAIGYEEKNPKLSSIVRNKMSPCWSFFFSVLIRCISGKTSGWDQAAGVILHLAYGLIMGKKIDYAKMIFEDICRKVGNGTLLYPRFLSLMMQTQSPVEIPTPVLELPVCLFSAKNFPNKPEEKDEKPLTTAMLSLLPPLKMSKKPCSSPPSKKSRRETEMAEETVDVSSESENDSVAEEVDTDLFAKQRPTAKGKDVAEVVSEILKRVEKLSQEMANLSESETIGANEAPSKCVIEENLVQQSDHIEEFPISPQRPPSPQRKTASGEDEHLDSDIDSHNSAFNDPALEERIFALEVAFSMIREKKMFSR